MYFKAAPYWLDEPQNLILAPGEDGRLVCRANGNPKPAIQWLVNGEPIEGEQGRICTSFTKNLAKDLVSDHESQNCCRGARHLTERCVWAPASQHINHLLV